MVNYSPASASARLDATFAALSDPTRRAILARLSQGQATVNSLAAPFAMSLPAVSKHLRVLESAGLLRREIDGRIHRCRLNAQPMKSAAAWIDHYRAFWETQFDALAKFLESSNSPNTRIDKEKIACRRHNQANPNQAHPNQAKPSPAKPARLSPSKSAAPSKPRAKKSSPPGPSANS